MPSDEQRLEDLNVVPAAEITQDNVHEDKDTGIFMFDDEAAVK